MRRQAGPWSLAYSRSASGTSWNPTVGSRLFRQKDGRESSRRSEGGYDYRSRGWCQHRSFDKDKYQEYLQSAEVADWLRNYAKEYGGNPYARLIELAKMAQQKGVIKGILLHQGETNNCDQTWPSKVKKIYENILADLGLDAKNVPLLVGELGQKDQGAACWGHNAIIDNIAATIPTAHVVSSKDCPLQSDKLHFTAEGYRMFGKRYADVMLELLGVVPVETATISSVTRVLRERTSGTVRLSTPCQRLWRRMPSIR